MHLRVLFHDNCFDGAASAAIFTRFYQQRVDPAVRVTYRGMTHTHGETFPAGCFDGEENVCVDFRYSSDPRLTWWFDHHVSAFRSPEDEAHFRADASGRKFFDPTARSCTKYLARICAERFGLDTAPLTELIDWAELIDSASFPSPQAAVEVKEPALRIMTWLESNHDHALTERLIAAFAAARPLAEIAAEPWITGPLEVILAQHRHALEVFREHTRSDGKVTFYDIAETGVESFNKFITYYLFPEARYVVGVSSSRSKIKISVGTNPWKPRPPISIATICERYGGGGHPVVGAISLGADQLDRARVIAAEIEAELKAAPIG